MKDTIFENLPHSSLSELIQFRDSMDQFYSEHCFLIEKINIPLIEYRFKFINEENQYYFEVAFTKFDIEKKINYYSITKFPTNIEQIFETKGKVVASKILPTALNWIEDVKKMSEVKARFMNSHFHFYESEFSTFFDNNDPDCHINPFELRKQEIIYIFLEYSKRKILMSADITEDEKKSIKQDIIDLQDNIPKNSKKVVVSTLNKIAKKIKVLSNKLFHDTFDVLKKEAIKKVLMEVYESLPQQYTSTKGWLDLLNL